MKLPLSTNFYKLISRTADKGKPQQYTLPYVGLLTGGKQYYWRVRAKDEKGVWSPWSKTFSFTTKAPNYPLDVALSYDKDKGIGTLKWKANPAGEKPAKYRVYGSDEKGFSVSDVPYNVSVGISKELSPQFPANFIAETAATELPVLGSEVTLPAANKTYYRVVAVDARGQAERTVGLCHRAPPGDLQQAGAAGQGGRGVPRPGLGQSLPGRPAEASARRSPTSGTSSTPSMP